MMMQSAPVAPMSMQQQQQMMPMQQQMMPMQQQMMPMQQQQQMMPMQPQVAAIPIVYATPENPWGHLDASNSLFIEQEMELLEVITGGALETSNRYRIYTDNAGLQFWAKEESDCCSRQLCAPNHGLTLNVHSINSNGPVIFKVEKPFKCCCAAIAPPCQKEATVKLVNDQEVGYIQQPCLGGCCTPTLNIYDKQGGTQIGTLTGPCLLGSLCSTTFELTDTQGNNIATFEKKGAQDLGDMVKQAMSDADKFSLVWSQKADMKLKSIMVGTVLFLDYLFFEGDQACGTTNPFTGEVNCVCCNIYCIGMTIPCGCKFKPDAPPSRQSY